MTEKTTEEQESAKPQIVETPEKPMASEQPPVVLAESVSAKPRRELTISRSTVVIAGVVVLVLVSFFAGMQFEKGRRGPVAAGYQAAYQMGTGQTGTGQNGFGSPGFRRSGGFGTVTAVSGSSITIDEQSFGPDSSGATTSKTYSISSSTTVTSAGQTASVSDIKTGDTVLIRTSSSSSSAATDIRIGDGGGPAGTQQSDNSGASDTTDTPANAI